MNRFKYKISFHIYPYLKRLSVIILSSLFILLAVFIITLGPRPYKGGLQAGDIAKETVRAPFDFFVRGEINKRATNLKREEVAKKIKDVYNIEIKKLEDATLSINQFFNKMLPIIENTQLNKEQKIQTLKEKTKFKLNEDLLIYLVSLDKTKLENIKEAVDYSLKEAMSKAIITDEEKNKLGAKTEKIIIGNEKTGFEGEVSVDSIWTIKDAKNHAEELINEKLKDDKNAQRISDALINQVLSNNLVYNEKLTQKRKQKAKQDISPVYNKIKIKENNIIVAKSQIVTEEHTRFLKRLQELQNKKETKISNIYYYLSISMFVVILFSLFWIYIRLYESDIISNNRYLLLIGLLSIIIIILSKAISMSFLSSYLIPLASISMLVAILLNARVAVVLTVFLSVFVGLLTGEQLSTFLYGLCGGLAGIYSVRNVRRRSQLLKAGLLVGIISSITIIGIDLLHNLKIQVLLKDSLWGITNGFICAFIVTGILPILEYLFKITTNISLLELSDLNHPLLKEMVIKAPGTYHHSLIVGNLAENAADAIGANSLLARVGAYYHDIGKLIKPGYFNENQMGFNDKHAEVNPKMSSLIIINHVKEGVEIAKKYKLNGVIIDFIKQHHGTSLTFYFYQRALEKEDREGEVNEEQFRYPGPLPQTKETAIMLLADSVEAATRAISQPNASKIKKTVQKIINNKFVDGQLDECDLTLKDLHKISESFSKLLVGIYHNRVEYPEEEKSS